MSKARTKERNNELQIFIKETKGLAYAKRAIKWFQQNLKEIVTSKELAQLLGRDNLPIQHSMRRVFELRDEKGYNIINWKYDNPSGEKLKNDEWMLLESDPNPKMIRDRGVNKRIMFDVFERDDYTCQSCGRDPKDDDPFKSGRKIKLHVGHITSHKQKDGSVANVGKKLTKEDFMTMCNICNEGAKNKNIKKITLLDRVKSTSESMQKDIYQFLKNKFNQ
jgi:hypothetical protein